MLLTSLGEWARMAHPVVRGRLAYMFKRMKRWYTYFAIQLLNTLALVVGITAAAYAYYAVRGGQAAPVYSGALHPRALHRMTTEEAKTFFEAFDRMGESETYLYQPWVEFSERVFHSDRLNVDEATPLPIRRTWRAPGNSQEPLIVWAFGGSTMFGWGVPDDETIASHLAKILSRTLPERAVTVVNHGHSYFFSSQELALFQTLLRRGGRGDFAVFLDGVN